MREIGLGEDSSLNCDMTELRLYPVPPPGVSVCPHRGLRQVCIHVIGARENSPRHGALTLDLILSLL